MKQLLNVLSFICLTSLVSCNSGDITSPTSNPANPESDLSGTVSSVLNFMNPISSAHAESVICRSPGKLNNQGVKVYLVDKSGNEEMICSAHLNSNGSFNVKLRSGLVPFGYQLKIKATTPSSGIHREAFVNTDSKIVLVNAETTLAVPVILDKWEREGEFKPEMTTEIVRDYVESCLDGVKISAMSPAQIAALAYMFKISKGAVEKNLFNDENDATFKKFVADIHKSNFKMGANGELSYSSSLVFNDENAQAMDEKSKK